MAVKKTPVKKVATSTKSATTTKVNNFKKVVKEEAKRDITKIVVDWKNDIPTIKVHLNYLKPVGSLHTRDAEDLVKEKLSNQGYGKNLTNNIKLV